MYLCTPGRFDLNRTQNSCFKEGEGLLGRRKNIFGSVCPPHQDVRKKENSPTLTRERLLNSKARTLSIEPGFHIKPASLLDMRHSNSKTY